MKLIKAVSFLIAIHLMMGSGHCCSSYKQADWQGFYLTGFLGGGWKKDKAKFINANYFNTLGPQVVGNTFDIDSKSGLIGGGALGFNSLLKYWVIGAEGGALLMNLEKIMPSSFFPDLDVFRAKLSYLAFVKLRTGFIFCSLFPFISGGWAGSSVKMEFEDIGAGVDANTGNKWANGWTVGAGCSYKITKQFSLGLAYDYYEFYLKDKKVTCPTCGAGEGFGTPAIKNKIPTQTITVRFDVRI